MFTTKTPLALLLLIPLAMMSFSACEDDTSFTLPVSEAYKISFTIDGTAQTLNGVDTHNSNVLSAGHSFGSGLLNLYGVSADRSVRLSISARSLPVVVLEDGSVELSGNGFAPATIKVSGTEMEGSVYCPHLINVEDVEYKAFVKWDSYENGVMKGRFMGDPDKDNPVELTGGSFELVVALY